MKKKIVFLTVLVFFIVKIYSQQEWASIGTNWYYTLYQDYEYGYIEIKSMKDTIVENKICKYLIAEKSVFAFNGQYIKEKVDSFITHQIESKIYLFNTNTRSFNLLYDFNPSIGDIWDLSEIWNSYNTMNTGHYFLDTLNCNKGKIIVDSIINISLNGKQLKSIYTSPYNNSSMGFSGTIIEGIGCMGYMMPIAKCDQYIDSWYPYPIRCFNSKDFNYSWTANNCDYITSIKEIKFITDISNYFNITEGSININLELEKISFPVNISIYSLNGIKLLNKYIYKNNYKIPIKDYLTNGIYLIEIKNDYSFLFNSKFILK